MLGMLRSRGTGLSARVHEVTGGQWGSSTDRTACQPHKWVVVCDVRHRVLQPCGTTLHQFPSHRLGNRENNTVCHRICQ
jgi:hypothetical protein